MWVQCGVEIEDDSGDESWNVEQMTGIMKQHWETLPRLDIRTRDVHSLKMAIWLPISWPTRSFSHSSHHCGHDSSPPIAIYTVTGGPQYCDCLGSAPKRSVQWYAQRAARMCMCMRMTPQARDGWWCTVPMSLCVVSNCYACWCNFYKLLVTTQLECGDWKKRTMAWHPNSRPML